MREYCGELVGKLWGWQGQAPFLYPAGLRCQTPLVGRYGSLRTCFTRLSTAVSHNNFSALTTVYTAVSPIFHSTYKDNNKVYKLVIS